MAVQFSEQFLRYAARAAVRDRKLDECFAEVDARSPSLSKRERWEEAHRLFREKST